MYLHTKSQEKKNLLLLEDKRPIRRFLIALAEGPLGPARKKVSDKCHGRAFGPWDKNSFRRGAIIVRILARCSCKSY